MVRTGSNHGPSCRTLNRTWGSVQPFLRTLNWTSGSVQGGSGSTHSSEPNLPITNGIINTPRATPKPRPLKPKSKALRDMSNFDDETEKAATALVSLQKPQPAKAEVESSDSESIDPMYSSEGDEDSTASGVEEEVDELADDSDSEC